MPASRTEAQDVGKVARTCGSHLTEDLEYANVPVSSDSKGVSSWWYACAGAYKCCLRFFLLFQHHTTPELSRSMNGLFGPPGTYSWCRQLGARVAIVGPDCRAERTVHRILTPQAYEALFAQCASSFIAFAKPHGIAAATSVEIS